jgi:hypothetical protein
MNDPIRCRASVIVRAAIARHLSAPISFVLEEHALDDDLGLDGLDLALVGIALAEDTGTSVELSLLHEGARVRNLVEITRVAMLDLIAPFQRAVGE